jgi:predicted Zn-dependent peptidase
MQIKFEKTIDYFLFFIILIKIIFVGSAIGHLIFSHLHNDRAQQIDPKLVYWKERTEFIFIVSMAILLIYQFHPRLSKKPIAIPRTEKDLTQLSGLITDTIYDNIQSPGIFMGFKFPDQNHPDSYALDMMNEVLSGGSSSRINKTIVEKKQMATFAFSFNYGLEDAGAGIFAAIASNGISLDSIQREFDAQIELIQNELISQEEFDKVRNKFENNLVSSNSSIAGIAENLANNHVYFGTASRVNTELDAYLKVTRDDIQRVARKYFTQNNRVILHYLPKEK